MRAIGVSALVMLAGCGTARLSGSGEKQDGGATPGACTCQAGFHCEYSACVPDTPPPQPPAAARQDPLAGGRYVFTLERDARRLVRIDSVALTVASYTAGLAPMDLVAAGRRELTVLLDAMDLVTVLDHRADPPVAATYDTARALSHLALSPTGDHALAYFDWDDPRAQERQSEPGNINQVSVVALADAATPFAEGDPRVVDVAVGFLPRDVRFAADGSRAIVVGRDTLTPIDLGPPGAVATPRAEATFDAAAAEILIDATATHALARLPSSGRIDVVDLGGAGAGCLLAPGVVTDIALDAESRLIVLWTAADGSSSVAFTTVSSAAPEPCAALDGGMAVGDATRLAADPGGASVVAYRPELGSEHVFVLDPASATARPVRLEKAVGGVAFAGDGAYALLANLKAPGDPAWDPAVEDPEVSVDKAYGVTWLDLAGGGHRLAVSDVPFGPFAFVPPGTGTGATYQSVLDPRRPQLLRVSHAPGFGDAWIDLAAEPLAMGYLGTTDRTYVTQSHPWGRVTFVDRTGRDLRHVTGFALVERQP